jgi:adenine deaminase
MQKFIHDIPKAELHIHIEGTLEPDLMLKLARKNGIALPYESAADIRRAYDFKDLQSFLDIYYQGAQVLRDADDFYQITWNYLQKAALQNVRHAEIFFDPQTHTARGVKFAAVVQGIQRALTDARRNLNVSSKLIMCFLRDLSAADAMQTLETALPFKEWITAVGLDSAEAGNPPQKFKQVFERARQNGFRAVAHAGEEGPPEYIWQALDILKAERLDHGVRCMEDADLVKYLAQKQIALTVCPLSNVRLRVFESMHQHNFKQLLAAGLCVTVNSDDPAYFGGYIEENFSALQQAHQLDYADIGRLCRNAFKAAFLNSAEKQKYLDELDGFATRYNRIKQ